MELSAREAAQPEGEGPARCVVHQLDAHAVLVHREAEGVVEDREEGELEGLALEGAAGGSHEGEGVAEVDPVRRRRKAPRCPHCQTDDLLSTTTTAISDSIPTGQRLRPHSSESEGGDVFDCVEPLSRHALAASPEPHRHRPRHAAHQQRACILWIQGGGASSDRQRGGRRGSAETFLACAEGEDGESLSVRIERHELLDGAPVPVLERQPPHRPPPV
mmetsp:Transcript_7058/g.14048  ORF Transcript_7058/g.14048 Transcript_7058/m.14048 type:complete len:218 (-) Transcript_7058:278-931(-)